MKKKMSVINLVSKTTFFITTLFMPTLWAESIDWQQVEKKARGQHVYFHAWGGSPEVNRYLSWTSKELKDKYGISLHHVKVANTAEVTSRLLAEKIAGKTKHGSVDLIWVNGENFRALKQNHMLFGPFLDSLPNWQYVDKSLPVTVDFSEDTAGLEAPWGLGQLVFIHDKQSLANPPQSFADMLRYAKAHPARLTYPKPPEFHGVSFLKSLLIELSNNDTRLQQPETEQSYTELTAPLWQYLDEFHQYAWRKGKQFPAGNAETMQLLDDKQIDLAISFNPNAVHAAKASGVLADSTEAYALKQGALSNIHFLAIPWNANAKEAALITINFLLSSEAQSRKGDRQIWGDPAILQPQYLTGNAKEYTPFRPIAEPHPSWQTRIEKDWLQRYGS